MKKALKSDSRSRSGADDDYVVLLRFDRKRGERECRTD